MSALLSRTGMLKKIGELLQETALTIRELDFDKLTYKDISEMLSAEQLRLMIYKRAVANMNKGDGDEKTEATTDKKGDDTENN